MIGKKIKHARLARGLTHTDMARLSGMHRQQIARIERSESITTRTLERIASALDMSVCDLWLSGTEKK